MGLHRIPAKKHPYGALAERTLLLLGAAGGALGEFIAMLCIRHKTKHLKFVISMPVFIVLHIVLFYRIFLL